MSKTYQKDVSKDTFEGVWPFKVNKGTILNIGGAILFRCEYKRIIKRSGFFAINGPAINFKKALHAKELPHYLRNSTNKQSVSDIIIFGLNLDPKWKN